MIKGALARQTWLALIVGLATIIAVLTIPKSNNYYIFTFADYLGYPGNDIFLLVTNLMILVWAWRKKLRVAFGVTLAMNAAVGLIVQGIKAVKIEPWYMRPHGGDNGFPSGHACHAFTMAFFLTMFFPKFTWLWYTLAVVISWSRVESEWHTDIQVMAGIILGIFIGWAFIAYWLRFPEARLWQKDYVRKGL